MNQINVVFQKSQRYDSVSFFPLYFPTGSIGNKCFWDNLKIVNAYQTNALLSSHCHIGGWTFYNFEVGFGWPFLGGGVIRNIETLYSRTRKLPSVSCIDLVGIEDVHTRSVKFSERLETPDFGTPGLMATSTLTLVVKKSEAFLDYRENLINLDFTILEFCFL